MAGRPQISLDSPDGRRRRVQAALRGHPRLKVFLGPQLLKRAEEFDALLNPLVQSLCGGSLAADLWESRLRTLRLRRKSVQEHFASVRRWQASRLGSSFDDALQGVWAELEAIETFADSGFSTILFLPSGQEKAADFTVRGAHRTAAVEVKRTGGLAQELRIAQSAVHAWRLLYPDSQDVGISIWATDEYHQLRIRGGGGQTLSKVRRDVTALLNRDQYERVIASIRRGNEVGISAGMIFAAPNEYSSSISVRPFASQPDGGLVDSMTCLRALSYIALRTMDALPQLFATAKTVRRVSVLVAYVYYDAWDLAGLDMSRLRETLEELLQWNRNINVVLHAADRDLWFFGRDQEGRMASLETCRAWASQVM
jgi:hypothetical protein